ncbi:WavE lipopolysaccharide synthesis family protein [Vibrio makurazakiensis]|uniref:WavE lipopolysaccharide synthesis family protein n=1 Tax=Vibrio makurazakiensis TaxID=2910250 RepID=UPI003D0B9E09
MKNSEITFVIQGPVSEVRTSESIDAIKKNFPGCQIILSTWKGESINGLQVDEVLFNDDPGASIFVYNKKNEPVYVNINRQIVSSLEGLRRVKTKYAVKLRADNILEKTTVKEIFSSYKLRDERFSIFNSRVVCANFCAREVERGLHMPYFLSDFFYFGETEDLIRFWDTELYSNYEFDSNLSGKKQHVNYPRDSIHVEQMLFTSFLNRYTPTSIFDEHGERSDKLKSRKYMINNFVIVDGSTLGLNVPLRLSQKDSFPYNFFTYSRWKWLYEREYQQGLNVDWKFKVSWYIGRVYSYLQKGWRLQIRKIVGRI